MSQRYSDHQKVYFKTGVKTGRSSLWVVSNKPLYKKLFWQENLNSCNNRPVGQTLVPVTVSLVLKQSGPSRYQLAQHTHSTAHGLHSQNPEKQLGFQKLKKMLRKYRNRLVSKTVSLEVRHGRMQVRHIFPSPTTEFPSDSKYISCTM